MYADAPLECRHAWSGHHAGLALEHRGDGLGAGPGGCGRRAGHRERRLQPRASGLVRRARVAERRVARCRRRRRDDHRRRAARAARGAAHRPLRLRARRRRAAHGGGRGAAPALALPQCHPARVLGELPRGRARQRPGGRPHHERDRDLPPLPRIGAGDHAQRRHRRRRLLRLLAGGAGRERRHRRGRGLRAAAVDRALERGLRARLGPARALPGRGRERIGERDRQRPRRGGRRALRHPGAEQLGERVRRGSPVIAALGLDRRLQRASHAAAYLVVNVPIAILGALSVLALILGAALSVAWIGLPLLLGAAAACRRLVRLDRRAANRLLGLHIPPVPGGPATAGSAWRRSLQMLSDRSLWRMVALLATKPLLIAGLCVVALVPLALLAEVLSLGVQGVADLGTIDYLGPWSLGPVLGLVLLALVPAGAVLVIATLDALYTVLCTIGRALLAPRAAPSGPVRELLAESLGDRSVAIAYWRPDREAFVDEAGRPVALPEPGSGRAWTAVEQDGRRVAAIVHDAALTPSRELVEAGAACSALAIDNERLKAGLQARVEELRVSRLRIMEAGDLARRRIERNLHDGAQQQLVALALELRMLKTRLKDPKIDELSERLATALPELRELARGIHPAILTDRGLAPAITSLAERGTLPIDVAIEVEERLPAPIEAAAYFLVAEALTNVPRYAQPTSARGDVRRDDGALEVLVADDGVGGVDPEAGSGLRGLDDRVAAVGGTLEIESPAGRGTTLRARMPL